MDVTVGDLLRRSIDSLEDVLERSSSIEEVLKVSGLEDTLLDLEDIQVALGEYKLDDVLDLFVREDAV